MHFRLLATGHCGRRGCITGAMMVADEMTLKQITKTIVPHPTQTELFDELARWRSNRLRRTVKK